MIRALYKAREQGKLRIASYSGENAELQWRSRADCTAIVSTASLEHLLQDMRYLKQGPLQPQRFESLRELFRRNGVYWAGQI